MYIGPTMKRNCDSGHQLSALQRLPAIKYSRRREYAVLLLLTAAWCLQSRRCCQGGIVSMMPSERHWILPPFLRFLLCAANCAGRA